MVSSLTRVVPRTEAIYGAGMNKIKNSNGPAPLNSSNISSGTFSVM